MEVALAESNAEVENNTCVRRSCHCFTSREHSKGALSLLPLLGSSPSDAAAQKHGSSRSHWDPLARRSGQFCHFTVLQSEFSHVLSRERASGLWQPSCQQRRSLQLHCFFKQVAQYLTSEHQGQKKKTNLDDTQDRR